MTIKDKNSEPQPYKSYIASNFLIGNPNIYKYDQLQSKTDISSYVSQSQQRDILLHARFLQPRMLDFLTLRNTKQEEI